MKTSQFVVYIEQDEDGVFVGSIPSIANCHAQGDTQEEMFKNLQEVLTLCLRNMKKNSYSPMKFIGIQNINIAYA